MTSKTKKPEKERKLFVQRIIKFAREQIELGRNYGWSEETLLKELDQILNKEIKATKREVLERVIRKRIAHFKKFKLKDFTNGWSGNESGECCEKCRMDLKEVAKSGRAVALKALVGCKDPFQISCKCHIPFRKVAGQSQLDLLREIEFELKQELEEEK